METGVGVEPTQRGFAVLRLDHSSQPVIYNGGNHGSRTHTVRILSPLPLPVGLHFHFGRRDRIRTGTTLLLR